MHKFYEWQTKIYPFPSLPILFDSRTIKDDNIPDLKRFSFGSTWRTMDYRDFCIATISECEITWLYEYYLIFLYFLLNVISSFLLTVHLEENKWYPRVHQLQDKRSIMIFLFSYMVLILNWTFNFSTLDR